MKTTKAKLAAKERTKLLEDLAQVNAELANLRDLMQAEVDVEPDEGDSEIFEREKNAALIAVLERRQIDIEAALKSMEKGEYGGLHALQQPDRARAAGDQARRHPLRQLPA